MPRCQFPAKLSDQKHLIEIGIDADKGRFNSIGLILYNDTVNRIKDLKTGFICKKGMPIFDTNLWGKSKTYSGARYIDNAGKFSLSLGEATMKIDLFNGEAENGIQIGKRVFLLFGRDKELISVLIKDIDAREMKAFN